MKNTIHDKKFLVKIFVIVICLFLTSCNHTLSDKKRIEVISDIAAVVMDNYTNEDLEKPLAVSVLDIERLTDCNNDLYKAIEKYDEIKQYNIYLINNKVIIVTDIIFQGVRGYVISDEELEKDLLIYGLGFDANRLSIGSRIEDSNIYTFYGGL